MASGPVEGRALLEAMGSAEAVSRADPAEIAAVVGQGAGQRIHAALQACDPHAEFRHMERLGLCGVLPQDPDWPPLLAAVHGAPLALWTRGAFEQADRFAVAVVGSRACTAYGLEQADRFAGWLAAQGFTVVSGGARGIDAAAHRSALRHRRPDRRGAGWRAGSALPARACTALRRHRGGRWLRVQRVPRDLPEPCRPVPAAQPDHQRPEPGHPPDRGPSQLRSADHGPAGGRGARTRGDGGSRPRGLAREHGLSPGHP